MGRWFAIHMAVLFSVLVSGLALAAPGPHTGQFLATSRESLQARIELAADEKAHSLDVLTFTLKEDRVGLTLFAAAIEIAKKGGRVRIGYDAFSSKVSPEMASYVISQGVDLRAFRPLLNDIRQPIATFLSWLGFNNRLHEKVFLINGEVAVLGSSNYSEDYFLAARQRENRGRWNFKDREILVRGAVAQEIQADLDQKWNEENFVRPPGADVNLLKNLPARKLAEIQSRLAPLQAMIQHLRSKPKTPTHQPAVIDHGIEYIADRISFLNKKQTVHKRILQLIREAKSDVVIENPYVILPGDMFHEIKAAVDRGVKIRLYTNGPEGSDEGDVGESSKKELAKLAAVGVEVGIYDLHHIFHGKVVVVDRRKIYWGSYNFDNRSKMFNLENGILFENKEIAESLEKKRAAEGFEIKRITTEGRQIRMAPKVIQCHQVFAEQGVTYDARPNPILWLKRPLL